MYLPPPALYTYIKLKYSTIQTKFTPMSSGLSKRKSAPTGLLRWSSLPELGDCFQLTRNHTTYQCNSQSAPSLAAPKKQSLSSQESLRRYAVCKKGDHSTTICNGSGCTVDTPTHRSHTNKAVSEIINNDSQQKPTDTISSSRTDIGPLREFVSLIYFMVI